MFSSIQVFVISLSIFHGCANGAKDWWEVASFYQIYPRSFQDSNGDGVGDLNGITSRLPYLKEIGIDATWLSPIFKSPMADFGYDISDFKDIQPEYGTLADFDALLKRAKEIGIKIILDFVPNHSSDECEWFQKSINREDGYDDFYVWHDGKLGPNNTRLPPSNWVSIFRGSMWTWNDKRRQFYLHQFKEKQPDLNYRNPKVAETMKDILRFWLDRGVDGFRIDAVPHILERMTADGNYEDEPVSGNTDDKEDYRYHRHTQTTDQDETLDVLYDWREVLDSYAKPTRILLAETYSPLNVVIKYFGNGNRKGAQIPFNFLLMSNVNQNSTAIEYKNQIDEWIFNMPEGSTANWVMGNHDASRIEARMGNDKIDLINAVLLTLPGISVNYYGEEIGMEHVELNCTKDCDARDQSRTPFQWNDSTSAGFSNSSHTWLPVPGNYKELTVKRQRGIARSHLNIYKELQKLRRTNIFQNGATDVITLQNNPNILIIKRSNTSTELAYLVICNVGKKYEKVPISEYIKMPAMYVLVTDKSGNRKGQQCSAVIGLVGGEVVIVTNVQ